MGLTGFAVAASAAGVDVATQQLIVGIAPDWNTDHGMLRLYERDPGGPWRPVTEAWAHVIGEKMASPGAARVARPG